MIILFLFRNIVIKETKFIVKEDEKEEEEK